MGDDELPNVVYFDLTSAKCDLRIEQQPEKREESTEKRDGHRRSSDVLATSGCGLRGDNSGTERPSGGQ